jgi:hypothetical protein
MITILFLSLSAALKKLHSDLDRAIMMPLYSPVFIFLIWSELPALIDRFLRLITKDEGSETTNWKQSTI